MSEPTAAPVRHPLEFGVALNPEAARTEELVRLARLADNRGLRLLGVMDHPYMPTTLDSWTLLSVLAASTEHIRLFPDVANLPLRPPAMLAKAAASLDLLSGGRVELGLGAGAAVQHGGGGMGGPRRSMKEAIEALEEGIAVIRRVWAASDEPAVYDGKHYRLEGVVPGPAPAHPIGVWVGAYGPRMVELTGRLADGWLPSFPYLDPAAFLKVNKSVDDSAVAASRSPSDVRRLYNIIGRIDPAGSGQFNDGPDSWIERLVELAVEGQVSGFMITPMADHDHQIEVFTAEIVPAVREALSKEGVAG
ncbi:LLM class flavin-dependent oxidoreductase [Streptomyces gibsoniae]|uniref:LLM class flavin-dependent oxidoreductase n=1 Tax=Streptomyces gibsoniae TaxID=3075529 RepID=A0ABU2U6U2_9ACTN|nr:LLM class flavin-dependent oxidoreductase [Streptomyces sp. DSM 41699]MDT0468951.1 LLM class flavin-dependent oxidoreductase [Streptomyces sp. DSM 41699]